MEIIWASSRDNSRTPMQWDSTANAGFSSGSPWMKVNSNYTNINVEKQEKDGESILSFYKKMISLKKANEVFTYGQYDLLLEGDKQIYAYTRTSEEDQVIIITNLSAKEAAFTSDFTLKPENLLLNNYPAAEAQGESITLKPYEARVYRIG
jgi:alpha-glucosidase